MTTWLVLDVSYLCYRNFYSFGKRLSHGDIPTGIVYGLLRDIQYLTQQHNTSNLVFAFDHGKGLRQQSVPTYKASRRKWQNKTEEEIDGLLSTKQQIQSLRRDYLPDLGYNNVLFAPGYEADDIIASVCHHAPRTDSLIIVSSDHDLYQLLNHRVRIWNPAKHAMITEDSFTKDYGIEPIRWPFVKAIAGCSSDDVDGIKGVGETTAVKFLTGKIKEGSAVHKRIMEGEAVWKANLPLVKLPYAGTPVFELKVDDVQPGKWQQLFNRLGIKSLTIPGVEPQMSVRRLKEGFGV